MAGYLTHYSNNLVLAALFQGKPFISEQVLYLGMSTFPANKYGFTNEPEAEDYERVPFRSEDTFFKFGEGGIQNVERFDFPLPQSDWGTILSIFVSDSPDRGKGHTLAISDLAKPKALGRGSEPSIKAGNLVLSHS